MVETLSPTVRVLEMGVGQGGDHLRSPAHERYYVIDNNDYDYATGVDLESLQRLYPHVRAIKASAKHLPFAQATFSRLEIRFPCGSLLVPGLQAKWRMDPRLKLQTPLAKTSWYNEFARVLQSEGEFIIWGDHLMDEEIIASRAAPYFALIAVRGLTGGEIRKMGTVCSLSMVGDFGHSRVPPATEVKQITMKKI